MILTLIVVFVLCCLAYWALHRIAGAFGLPGPIVTLLDVLLVVVFVIYLLQALGLLGRVGLR